ncbi:cytochrome c-type biogenesis protein [Teredinibacter sp. KSP-S5-2]|uniref:cytochrome c-type biogenesis protein n=1 Tax=Teredinibacter sp. KSP-S5-2 TaxID=3034506 RepID=UPI002934C5FB|nr:cytochrome c-type biogenesis protein [Teredinibacter sp. KSP-S5-2]WNO07689.1 cytochrome c-type biogenesis protein CcmH [Teredinibacter sp. KSP-S5-2]
MNNVQKLFFALCFCFIAAMSGRVFAEVDVFDFDTDSQRLRYQDLAAELRCPKCQNQNLIDSNSQISADLRKEVVRLIKEGKSDREVKAYLVQRYGDFVLYKPPFQGNTLVLWWGPVFLLFLGLLVFVVIIVQRQKQPAEEIDTSLDESEQEVLASWVADEQQNEHHSEDSSQPKSE